MRFGSPIAVVGAGIAGLSAALAFARAGFSVEIFERSPELLEAGAGIQLSPNALRALEPIGAARNLSGGVPAQSVLLRSGRSGRIVADVPVSSSDGTGYLSIHRADLQRALASAVAATAGVRLRLGWELAGLRHVDGGVGLSFRPPGREGEAVFPLVVGADGVRSRVATLIGAADARPSGAIAWRMMLEGAEGGGGIEAWLGRGKHAVAYPVEGGRRTNVVLIEQEVGDLGDPSLLIGRFHGWDERLLAMVRSAGAPTPWPLSVAPADRRWRHEGRILLIGDAAHAMLPYAAQGAAMAIEDAVVAASCFAAAADAATAIDRYVEARRARVSRVRGRVSFHDVVYHLPFPLSLARNTALALRSRKALRRDLSWLYDWTPPDP